MFDVQLMSGRYQPGNVTLYDVRGITSRDIVSIPNRADVGSTLHCTSHGYVCQGWETMCTHMSAAIYFRANCYPSRIRASYALRTHLERLAHDMGRLVRLSCGHPDEWRGECPHCREEYFISRDSAGWHYVIATTGQTPCRPVR